jgi:hypothetical protein
MALPIEKTKSKEHFEEQIILLFGIPKIGKSTFLSKFPSVLFLATEDGLRSLESFQKRIYSWEDYLGTIAELKSGNHEFKTVGIDTTDNLAFFCKDYVMRKFHIQHASDLEWGKGWDLLKDEARRGINKLTELGMGIVFVSHSKEQEIKKKGQEPVTKVTYNLPSYFKDYITSLADIILFATFEDGKRVLHTKPSEDYEAGDRTGRLPDTLPLNYEKFMTAFYSGNDQESIAKDKLVMRIKKAEGVLAEKKIDNFDTEKRVMNSRKKHLGTEDIDKAPISALQEYIQHLTTKYKGAKANGANSQN